MNTTQTNNTPSEHRHDLPPPLGDPLLGLAGFNRLLMRLLVFVAFVVFLLAFHAGRWPEGLGISLALLVLWPVLRVNNVILPDRPTNAFYVRAFRNDDRTLRLRLEAQAALGREFRLSGIRDPRRRRSWWHHLFGYGIFALRYSSPKYMDLESGPDWRQRLWRTLGDARCVLVDARDITPSVMEETYLVLATAGADRTLFIVDGSRTLENWRTDLASSFWPLADVSSLQMIVWDDSQPGRRRFREGVRMFASRLPQGAPGLVYRAWPDGVRDAMPDEPCAEHSWTYWIKKESIGFAASLGLMVACSLSPPMLDAWRRELERHLVSILPSGTIEAPISWHFALVCLFAVISWGYLLYLSGCYFIECGSARKRAAVIFAYGYPLLVLAIFQAVIALI